MKTKMKFWFCLMALSSLVYITWRALFTLPIGFGAVALIAGIALFASELISVLEALVQFVSMSRSNKIELPEIPESEYPDVDILIATHSEDTELLFKTVNGCIHMKYPDPSKVHIYLCDDNNRPEIAKFAESMNIGYFGLSGNKDAKAGNLNNALSKTSSPLIVTFDADMIPRSEFLMKTVGYFSLPKMICEKGTWRKRTEEEIDSKYKIGFIQTPQSFYNPDLFQFNYFAENSIPNEQDFFFREINVGRNASNSPIYAGSNTVISREALEAVGGIHTNTITEDFATGIDIQAKGYSCYAIPEVLASGLAPEDFPNLIKQRQRWGRGCVQTVRNFKFLFGKLPFFAKLSYLSCLCYWWTFIRRIIYILAPILFTVFGVISVKINGPQFLFIWIPYYLIYNHSLKLLSGKTRDQKWSNIVDTILAPYLIIPIFLETIGIRMRSFFVTSKERSNQKSAKLIYAVPHMVLLAATLVGLYFGIRELILYKNLICLIVLFWLALNGYFLFMAILFMLGRINFRSSERYYAAIPISFSAGPNFCNGITKDISENGFSFATDFPYYIPENTEFEFTDEKWPVKVRGNVVHVLQSGDIWKYSVRLLELEEEAKLQYYELVYDRYPSLASEIRSNAWKDLVNFFKRKASRGFSSNRHLPRIPINKQFETKENGTVTMINFNYKFALLKDANREMLSLSIGNNLILELKKAEAQPKAGILYEVLNWQEIVNNKELYAFLQKELTQ